MNSKMNDEDNPFLIESRLMESMLDNSFDENEKWMDEIV